MSSDSRLDSLYLQDIYKRLAAGDPAARNDLIVKAQARLEKLARKMLSRFPAVHRWEDTGDVFQTAMMRLLRALEEVQPQNQRAFFGLAAEQIRRVLLDLARHYRGAMGLGAHHASVKLEPRGHDSGLFEAEVPSPVDSALVDMERWCAFHEAISQLPAVEREVMGLAYYHGWTQMEIATLLQVHERTVRRYWQSACLKLHERVGGDFPDT